MALGSTITQITESGLKPGITFPSFNATGIATASNFKTGTTDVHSTGVTVATSVVGSAVTSNSTGIDVTGIITATSFTGSGANLTGVASTEYIHSSTNAVLSGIVTTGPLNSSTGNFSSNVTISGNLGVAGTITYEDVARVDATGISTFREGFGVGPLAGIALTAYKDGSIRTSGIVTAASFVGDGSGLTGAGPSLANGVDNRVVTASSATALNGEANLTFDGSVLNVTGNVSTTDLLLAGDITHIGDTNTRIKFASNDIVTIQTDGADRLRITDGGVIEMGTAIGGSGFDSNARLRVGRANDCNIAIRATGDTTSHTGIYFGDSAAANRGYIQYMNDGDYMRVYTNGNSERFRIGSAGQLGIGGATYGGAGNVLKSGGSGAAPTWGVGGKVLQVKMAHSATKIDTTTANTDCLTCSITPTATTSNILVMTTFFYGGNMNPNGGFRFTRGGTVLEGSGTSSPYGGATGAFWSWDDCGGTTHSMEAASFNWLDTGPSGNGVNTTSAVDYKLEAYSFTRLLFNRGETSGESRSTLILMEVSA